jgi:D-alanine-D-alanine ligase
MGVSVKNVVHTDEELQQRISELQNGYHGWDLAQGGIFLERFIKGREYTSFIVGNSDHPEDCIVYEPVERAFHASLPENEKFLSFDRLWEIYDEESPMPNQDNFYTYHPVPDDRIEAIRKLSLDAYRAVGGQGSGRLDLREDAQTGKLFVLEVNTQCGLSEDEDYTSIGAILKMSGKTFSQMVSEIIYEALNKRKL